MCNHGRSEYEPCDLCDEHHAGNKLTKAAQVAAIRKRLGDMWHGITMATAGDTRRLLALQACYESVWPEAKRDMSELVPLSIDKLAAWLWERGCRA